MDAELFFEQQQWRQWLTHKPRFATEVIAGFVERARACAELDQSIFAAALFEAIWGRAPARGQAPVPPTRRQGVPAWVLPTLVRGLSDDPRLRFPSTRSLLDALDRNTFGRRSELMFVSA